MRKPLGSIVIGYNGLLATTLLVTSLTGFIVGQLNLPKSVGSMLSMEEVEKVEANTIDASEDAFKQVWQSLQEFDTNAKNTIYKYVGHLSDL